MPTIVFWAFNVINGLTALGMFLGPRRFHESTLVDPERAYQRMGFSPTAVEMVHNVIRGQGAALLAVSLFLILRGAADPSSYLLIALVCGLSLVAHIQTALHHLRSPTVMEAIGSIKPMYVILVVNLLIGGLAAWSFARLTTPA
jgi:hypothetical protein